jgi:tRNA (adenine37-N6)-methyltransferase
VLFALDSPTRRIQSDSRWFGSQAGKAGVSKSGGIDFFDGTPILDIKAYRPEYRADEFDVPEWYKKLKDARGHI